MSPYLHPVMAVFPGICQAPGPRRVPICPDALCVPWDRDRSLRDEWDQDKISRDCPVPSLLTPMSKDVF